MTHAVYCKNHGLTHKEFIENDNQLSLTIFRECDMQEKTFGCEYEECDETPFYYIAYVRKCN